jgi:AcrR family transcriptional regulator
MTAPLTARAVARRELTAAITTEARRQLAEHGPDGLSLRAVARSLGMASSAVYRYFASRDELLTALIIDSYTALADALEEAYREPPRSTPRKRWLRICRAARQWAVAHPHEYALLYGSPVPGYRAPRDTVDPAARIPLALLRPLRDAWRAGAVADQADHPLPGKLRRQLEPVAAALAPDVPPAGIAAAVGAWSHLFGLISFELFGHFVGSADPAGPFFEYEIAALADRLGLVDGRV